MKESKYKILFNYGPYEGMRWVEEEYETVDDAVKAALEMNGATLFQIVRVIDWEAKETN